MYEAKKPLVCYRCLEPGHISTGCRNPKVVFSVIDDGDENARLLEPYLHDLRVNGKACRVLRDSAATMDIIRPEYVGEDDFTGKCALIRQVVGKNSKCLPIARVNVEGPFGVLSTEAAVLRNLTNRYPYLFSNRSDQMLRDQGLTFGEGTVHALTRSKVPELGAQK